MEQLHQAVELLPEGDRQVLSFLLDNLGEIIETVRAQTAAISALDRMDDVRKTEIDGLRELIEAYAPTTEPLPTVVAEPLRTVADEAAELPFGMMGWTSERREAYWSEFKRLRERRKADVGELNELVEREPDGYRVHALHDPADDTDPISWWVRVIDPHGDKLWGAWRGSASEAMWDGHEQLAAIRRGDEAA